MVIVVKQATNSHIIALKLVRAKGDFGHFQSFIEQHAGGCICPESCDFILVFCSNLRSSWNCYLVKPLKLADDRPRIMRRSGRTLQGIYRAATRLISACCMLTAVMKFRCW